MTRIEEDIKKFVKERLGLPFFRLYSVVDNKSFTLNSLILEFIERERMKMVEEEGTQEAIQKVIDCMEGKTTSQLSPLDQLKSILNK